MPCKLFPAVLLLLPVVLSACEHSRNANSATETNSAQTQAKRVDSASVRTNTADKSSPTLRINQDSVELTALVRTAYAWHQKALGYGFPLKYNPTTDSLFTGIDWPAYHKEYAALKKTSFFADDFLARHRAIAMTIDSSVSQASADWRNANDGIPLWYSDADDWCNCQDYPDNYWERLTLSDLTFTNNTAAFNWRWDEKDGVAPAHTYAMKARKVNGNWKISYLEGFQNYGTVADYNKQMRPSRQ